MYDYYGNIDLEMEINLEKTIVKKSIRDFPSFINN